MVVGGGCRVAISKASINNSVTPITNILSSYPIIIVISLRPKRGILALIDIKIRGSKAILIASCSLSYCRETYVRQYD
jgi:hypothetical protein